MADCKKSGAAFWATVVVVVALVAYPLSFGPACWISCWTNTGQGAVSLVYRPITWTFGDPLAGQDPLIGRLFQAYATIPSRPSWYWRAIVDGERILYWTWDGVALEDE